MTPQLQPQQESRISWFEIPVADLDRANRFYETIFDTKLSRGQFGPDELAVFSYVKPAVGGCIGLIQGLQPSANGTLCI
ncbi:MAG: hypothetical protein WDO73_18595 [Ignavibacteriota bacterium]